MLKGVSLELRPRELLHVAGPNGAGKTTLLRVATGLLQTRTGQRRLARQTDCERAARSINPHSPMRRTNPR